VRRVRSLPFWTCLLALFAAGPAAAIAPGDLNGDGVWDARDALLLEQHLRGEITLSAAQLAAADVAPIGLTAATAGDGVVDAGDLVVLLRFLGDDDLDGDGLSAAFEVAHGFSPFVTDEDGNGVPDGFDDDDQDGLTNRREEAYGTDPANPDSDADGVLDGRDAPAPALARTQATDLHAATAYLYTGIDPLQADLAATIDPTRVAIVRGLVRDAAGEPFPGVAVSIEGRPEYGTTRTLVDGQFDLAVNGGERLTLVYERQGHPRLRRRIQPPWLDYATAQPVTLLPRDTGGTGPVVLPAPATASVWRGTPVTDAMGTRRPTIIFQPGTTAAATLAGNPTPVALPEVTVQATETSIDVETEGTAAVPLDIAPLHDPIWVGEFVVEEAETLGAVETVTFANTTPAYQQQPIVFYAEELLQYPTGTLLERGTLDEAKGAWVPDTPGKVVTIVSINGAGEAQVDTDTTPGADNAGIEAPERKRLGELYAPGQKLIRYPLKHFSFGCGHKTVKAPAGARNPDTGQPEGEKPDPPCTQAGSVIACESQGLGEAVGLTGVPWSLHYTSERTPGYRAAYDVRIPITGPTIPAVLEPGKVSLEVQYAGLREVVGPIDADVDISHLVSWPGTDAYGRRPQGRQPIRTRVRWHYPPDGAIGPDGNALPGSDWRTLAVLTREWTGFVGPWDNRAQGLGGWTLTPVHHYDARTRALYRGDGEQVIAEQLPAVIDAVNADPLVPWNWGIALAPDGGIYVGQDHLVDQVGHIAADGSYTHIAGKSCVSGGCSLGDGGPAKNAYLRSVEYVALAPDGSLYISDRTSQRIRRVAAPATPDSIITTAVGTGTSGYLGDGGQASAARINAPTGLVFAADGTLYLGDSGNRRIRRVRPDGIIETIAGIGSPGGALNQCQGHAQNPQLPKRALEAQIGTPRALALGSDGSLYLTSSCNRIYRITSDGWLHLVAGNGLLAAPAEGALATATSLPSPWGVAVAADGSVYVTTFSGTNHNRLHRIGPDGKITTVAGDGTAGGEGDGGPAAAARLDLPRDVAIDAQGRVYVSDGRNNDVRRIEPPLPSYGVGAVFVPSRDGREVYEFDGAGRHVRTLDALRMGNTPQAIADATKLTFAWNERGLASITDADGNVTAVERDTQGVATAIVGPFGDRTELEQDANGWLERIENPAGEAHVMVSREDGLLTSFTTPRSQTYAFEYDAKGRLVRDDDPAGGFQTLERTESATGWTVAHETALGRTTTYGVDRPGAGAELRTVVDPAGLTTTRTRNAKFEATTVAPGGTTTLTRPAADPRLGFTAAFGGLLDVLTPGGRHLVRTQTRTTTVDANGLLTGQTDTVVLNTRTSITVWDHDLAVPWNGNSPGLRRTTSAASRILDEALDARGRPVGSRLGTLHPVRMSYDGRGRVDAIHHGPGGAGDRTTTFAYHPTTGRLASITDPASRATTFDLYDAAGRVLAMTLPGGRTVAFGYDASGNLTALSPPGRPAHVFRYTALDQEEEYEPPPVTGVTNPKTVYEYDLDRNLTLVTRPDGKTVDLGYEPASGRLATVTIAEGFYGYGYHATTDPQTGAAAGQLATLTAPGGQTLAYGWDGVLPTSTQWSGPVAGSVTRGFDDDFRVASESVNGTHTISYQYDPDSLVTAVVPASGPALTLTRDPSAGFGAGLLTGTTQDAIATVETPSAFGELETLVATQSGNPLYVLDVATRDALGRIETKAETIGAGPGTTSLYTYDTAGRLDTVTVNGTLTADYAYDPNGNRTHEREDLGGPPIAVYDDQDRLLSYAGTTYTYSAAGDLETKTDVSGTTTYGYDALGNLRSVQFPDGKQVAYDIDGQNRRVGKKVCPTPCTGGATPQPVQGFLYGDQLRIVAELDGSNAVVSRFVYATRPNVPDFVVKDGTTYRILSDQVGSVRLVVDASTGAVAQRIDYDAFGTPTYVTGPPDFQPFGFAGGLADRDTGLVRFGARDYDPRVGRWTSKDPIGFEGGYNHYAYVLADPVNGIDVDGLEPLFGYGEALGFYGRTSLQGLAAFADGLNLFGNPLAGSAYDPCDPTLRPSHLSGQAVLAINASLGVPAAGLRLAGYSHRLALHGAHHNFGRLGRLAHLQMNIWRPGVSGSGRTVFRLPLPWR
jgi:RHS repeat-associated protein